MVRILPRSTRHEAEYKAVVDTEFTRHHADLQTEVLSKECVMS